MAKNLDTSRRKNERQLKLQWWHRICRIAYHRFHCTQTDRLHQLVVGVGTITDLDNSRIGAGLSDSRTHLDLGVSQVTKKLKIKVPKKSTLKHKADALWSKLVRARDGKCMLKGLDHLKCGPVLQGGHIIGRTDHSLRWALINGLGMCSWHNVFYFGREGPLLLLIAIHYPGQYEWIRRHDDPATKQITVSEYQTIIALLQQGNKEICIPCLREKAALSTNSTTT